MSLSGEVLRRLRVGQVLRARQVEGVTVVDLCPKVDPGSDERSACTLSPGHEGDCEFVYGVDE